MLGIAVTSLPVLVLVLSPLICYAWPIASKARRSKLSAEEIQFHIKATVGCAALTAVVIVIVFAWFLYISHCYQCLV